MAGIITLPRLACPVCFSVTCSIVGCEFAAFDRTPFRFNAFYPFYLYHSGSRPFFRRWKKAGRTFLLERLANEVRPPNLDAISGGSFDLILPMPQSAHRLIRLGRSTSGEVARLIQAQALPRIPIFETVAEPRAQQGKNSGYGRFARTPLKTKTLPEREVRGASILIVDDFLTSGSTLLEFGQILHELGARRMSVAALGVALRRDDRSLPREETVELSPQGLEAEAAGENAVAFLTG